MASGGRSTRARSAHFRPAQLLALGVVGSILSACGGGGQSETGTSPRASYSTLLGAGGALLRQGNVAAAEQLYHQAIAKRPGDPTGHYDLGVAYQAGRDLRDAQIEYQRALARSPHYVPALFNDATLVAPRNPLLAMFYYRVVIHTQPNSPTALLNLGLLESRSPGLRTRSLIDLGAAVRLDRRLLRSIPQPLRNGALHPPKLPHRFQLRTRHGRH
jgi:tetratricopeptide (TPR) repeat protein